MFEEAGPDLQLSWTGKFLLVSCRRESGQKLQPICMTPKGDRQHPTEDWTGELAKAHLLCLAAPMFGSTDSQCMTACGSKMLRRTQLCKQMDQDP